MRFDSRPEQWEAAAADALRDGGVGADGKLFERMAQLVSAAPLPQNDAMRNELLSGTQPTERFVSLLQRARLHRHLLPLLSALDGWVAHAHPVWDVIELIETLRSQHVFPMSMLRLAEHEWDDVVGEAAERSGRPAIAFDADQ